MRCLIVNIANRIRHPPAQNHRPGQCRYLLNIPRRPVGDPLFTVFNNFSGFPGHAHGDLLGDLILEIVELVHLGQAHHHAKCTAARNDRGLINRVAFRQLDPDNRMAGFVIRRHFLLLFGQHHRAPLGPHHHLILGEFKILHGHIALAGARRRQRRLVDQVGQISPGEPRRAAGNDPQVHIRPKRNFARMDIENFLAPVDIWVWHMDLPVKPARAQQRLVKHISPVGCRQQNYALIGLKPVHLDQKLVQGLLALVIAAAHAGATMAANSVDLVNKHDAWRVFLGLLKHVAHPRGTNTHKHFNKIRAGNSKERHTRLTGNRAGQQGFAGARRANQQRPFGDFATQAAEFLRVLQKLDNLFQLFFGLVNARHVREGHLAGAFCQHFGAGFAKAHRPALTAALHAVHEINPHTDQQYKRQKADQDR